MNLTNVRFGTLYRLDVYPREQALADTDATCRSGRIDKMVRNAEHQKTGEWSNQSTVFEQGEFYGIAGNTWEESLKVEEDFFARLPRLERFVLEKADDEAEAAEVLGEARVAAIRQEMKETLLNWLNGKLQRGEVETLRVDLND